MNSDTWKSWVLIGLLVFTMGGVGVKQYVKSNNIEDESKGSSNLSILSMDEIGESSEFEELEEEPRVSVLEFTNAILSFRSIEYYKPPQRDVEILFLGDMMMGRYVRTLMDNNTKNYPFEKLPEGFFDGYDMVIANLEGPITTHFVTGGTSMIFGFPTDTAKILKEQGITFVSLANNHSNDKGDEGYKETVKYLSEAGIEYVGRQNQEDWETSVKLKKINGAKMTFITVHDAIRRLDQEEVIKMIKRADPMSDYVIIMPHWGIEYQHKASTRQKELAHSWVEAGADMVVGHHPHVVQNMEEYKGVPIFYSLGNFVFDQYFSTDVQEELALKVIFTKDKIEVSYIPMKSAHSQSSLMEEEAKKTFLKKMADWSGKKADEFKSSQTFEKPVLQ